jgi:hypothetical protein
MLRAMAKRITVSGAEILGISCQQLQRWKTRFEHEGYEGLFDRRCCMRLGVNTQTSFNFSAVSFASFRAVLLNQLVAETTRF